MEWLQDYTLWVIIIAAMLFIAACIELVPFVAERVSRKKRGYPLAKPPARIVVEALYAGACVLVTLAVVLFWAIPRAWKGVALMFSEHLFLTSLVIALAPAALYLLAWLMDIKWLRKLAYILAAIVVLMWFASLLQVTRHWIKYLFWDLPLKVNDLPPFNGEWLFVGHILRWLILVALGVIIVAGVIQFVSWRIRLRKARSEAKKDQAGVPQQETRAKKVPPELRDWRKLPYFITPPGWRAVILLLGKPVTEAGLPRWLVRFRDGRPGLGLKLPLLEDIMMIDARAKNFDLKSASISTGGYQEEEVEWEEDLKDFPKYLVPKVPRREGKRVEAQGLFDCESLIGIEHPIQILNYDPELLKLDAKAGAVFRGILNDLLQNSLPQIPILSCYMLPARVICLGTIADIVGKFGEEGYARWEDILKQTTLTIGTKPDGTNHDIKLFTEFGFTNPVHVKALMDSERDCFVTRIIRLGFRVDNFSKEDFNPEEKVLTKLDAITEAKLERSRNQVALRQEVDTEIVNRAKREIRTIGSAKSISRLLDVIATDILKRFNIEYRPTSEQITYLIPLMEHYRTIRESKDNKQFLIDLGRFFPGIEKAIESMHRGGTGPGTPASSS